MADNVTHALTFSATVRFTFYDEDEDIAFRNGLTPEEGKEKTIYFTKITCIMRNATCGNAVSFVNEKLARYQMHCTSGFLQCQIAFMILQIMIMWECKYFLST